MKTIEIEGLTKRYRDVVAVDDLTLDIQEGETFALLGVNGAGKSTTIRMLTGLSTPTKGDARVLGHSVVTEPNAVKPNIAVVMQETAVGRNLSVQENMALFAAIYGLDKGTAKTRIDELLHQFELDGMRTKRAKTLSGGCQRKLSIALGLLAKPAVLFLDEPTLGLDVLARRELWQLIRTLQGKITIVLTTHYLEEAEAMADRIGVMRAGKLLAVGTVAQLKKLTGCDKLEDAFVALASKGAS